MRPCIVRFQTCCQWREEQGYDGDPLPTFPNFPLQKFGGIRLPPPPHTHTLILSVCVNTVIFKYNQFAYFNAIFTMY